ncbi:hypothetical protein D9756_003551 [Leucocoprinus leucothites]|uniref:Transmembrane protein n=1 Tax=Leucocoprinus leucothites TaxID=201217 RepID=A0A8H5G737_9AGAR|nr:hypothetical protein D9756_003551 [Leucoagaricus leucothites]
MAEIYPHRASHDSGEPNSERPPSYQESSHASHVRRFAAFLTLEGAFLALEWYCYTRPRALPDFYLVHYFQLATLKSGFISLFNFWHTVAVACATEICYEAFSKEWDARRVEKERTDRVSKVTGGVFDRACYFFERRATKTYRAGFIIFLGLLLMGMTGPSAVTVIDGVETETWLEIGLITTQNLTPDSANPNNPIFLIRLAEANMVVKLEQVLDAPWGYVPSPNWLIPLPVENLDRAKRVTYTSDVASFNYSCRWQSPDSIVGNTVTVENNQWSGNFVANSSEFGSAGNATSGSKVLMRKRHEANVLQVTDGSSILQLSPRSMSTAGISVYLLLGGNQTVQVRPNSTEAWIDLSNLPTVYNPDYYISFKTESRVRSPIATLLICDPRLQFATGTVILNPTPNITDPDIRVVLDNPPPPVGNVDQSAAQTLFTSVLSTVVNEPDPITPDVTFDFINFNYATGKMMLDLPPLAGWTTLSGVHPFNLTFMDSQLDRFTLSALKAFTNGYKGDGAIRQSTGNFTTDVSARSTSDNASLATSVQFAILHSVFWAHNWGNIDRSAAQTLFTSALSIAVNEPDPITPNVTFDFINFNYATGEMILDLPLLASWTTLSGVHPFNLTFMDSQLDRFTFSALKTFTNGYKGDGTIRQSTGNFTTDVSARSTSVNASLATSVQFTILHSILFALLGISLAELAHLDVTRDRTPFSLEVLKKE